ncbi:cytochrome o ubiquinol oxidase subunit IV [Bradyrhizobium genosp. L]|uniref:cytochrome o ubiquinol oxidase subunit IV n=1 Tax=Bradyrhizobium genosp. L TaxID=83637 RepID=UPI0018A33AD4|nr:cytochrome o ubiquinol oxidase subunit IV [Bradyrhizobium genosp. L]QPF85403.1 cytochrome o ubiquinol oxidase subunit IV [Bradyrhizobium genosp. L]
MNTEAHALEANAGGHGGHHVHDAAAHGSLKTYLIGFGLSVVLTAIPFWLVMTGAIADKQVTAVIVLALAAVQIVVHMVYFLHMNTRSENGWIMMALIFTVIMVLIGLTGSLWVMHHLNTNMMPVHDMSQMP